jgi:putative solute:sodium symporter small subunit
MTKYATHNQSVLTDFAFLGFPFHYFYSGVFLLILFVFLCWLYCIRLERLQKKYSIHEEN